MFQHQGVSVVVDKVSMQFVFGSEVDYVDGLQGAGFSSTTRTSSPPAVAAPRSRFARTRPSRPPFVGSPLRVGRALAAVIGQCPVPSRAFGILDGDSTAWVRFEPLDGVTTGANRSGGRQRWPLHSMRSTGQWRARPARIGRREQVRAAGRGARPSARLGIGKGCRIAPALVIAVAR